MNRVSAHTAEPVRQTMTPTRLPHVCSAQRARIHSQGLLRVIDVLLASSNHTKAKRPVWSATVAPSRIRLLHQVPLHAQRVQLGGTAACRRWNAKIAQQALSPIIWQKLRALRARPVRVAVTVPIQRNPAPYARMGQQRIHSVHHQQRRVHYAWRASSAARRQ